MFVGRDVCELPVMAALDRRNDARYYLAVELSIRLPWFVVNTVVLSDKQRYLQSMCCAWERDVADLCVTTDTRHVVSIQQMAPVDEPPGSWAIRHIAKVWRALRPDGTEEVVLQDNAGTEFSGAFGAAPSGDLSNRQLLFSLELAPKKPAAKRRSDMASPNAQAPVLHRTVDPMSKLTADRLGHLLGGLDADAVIALESRGQLFSVIVDGRRLYPAVQASPTLPRTAIADVLAVLKTYEASVDPHDFFASLCADLDLLSPIEVLLGGLLRARAVHEDVPQVLAASVDQRIRLVVAAAEAHAAALFAS